MSQNIRVCCVGDRKVWNVFTVGWVWQFLFAVLVCTFVVFNKMAKMFWSKSCVLLETNQTKFLFPSQFKQVNDNRRANEEFQQKERELETLKEVCTGAGNGWIVKPVMKHPGLDFVQIKWSDTMFLCYRSFSRLKTDYRSRQIWSPSSGTRLRKWRNLKRKAKRWHKMK